MAPILEFKSVTKTFGGLSAVKNMSFSVDRGEILSIIGPNGSGKTTAFNLITGIYQPDYGDILYQGESVVGLRPDQVQSLGISRTFQLLRLFSSMTVLENVLVGMHGRMRTGVLSAVLRLPSVVKEEREARVKAKEILALFPGRFSEGRQGQPAQSLSYANRRRLEIARALASDPKLLLLDEPVAGMNPAESMELMHQIRGLRDAGHTVLMIEHDMKVIMGASDRVIVMDHGEKIAEGLPEVVAKDPVVVEAYLGKRAASTA